MVDRGTVAIRDANRLASAATGCCADKVNVVAGREAEVLFWRSDGWAVVLGDKASALVGDGGCLTVPTVGAHHKVGSAKADGCMGDGATCFACSAADEAGRVLMSPDSTDCVVGAGNLCTGAVAAASGQVASV